MLLFEFFMYFFSLRRAAGRGQQPLDGGAGAGRAAPLGASPRCEHRGAPGMGGGPLRGAGLETPALGELLGEKIEEKSLGFTLPSRGEGS